MSVPDSNSAAHQVWVTLHGLSTSHPELPDEVTIVPPSTFPHEASPGEIPLLIQLDPENPRHALDWLRWADAHSVSLRCGAGEASPLWSVDPGQILKVGNPEQAGARLIARCLLAEDLQFPSPPAVPAPASEPFRTLEKAERSHLPDELERLRSSHDTLLVEAADHEVFLFRGEDAPALLTELGRQRELTFQAAGQGVGHAIDLADEDLYYHHLVLWNRPMNRLVGAYRVGFTDRLIAESGPEALYLSHVFEMAPEFFESIGPAMELSRSIVVPDFQRDGRALNLLWRGLGTIVARDPRYRTLFGSVTISNAFRPASRAILKRYLEAHFGDAEELRARIQPRRPFETPTRHEEAVVAAFPAEDLGALKALIEEAEDRQRSIPPLVRYYLSLGARFLGFHVEASFNDALYCLLRVDLAKTEPRILKRFLGDGASAFA